jgi:L-asparagine transporter-like permease
LEGKNLKNHEKGISAWHLTMMALGSVIGGSFFLGSAVAINSAGPSILIAYIIAGILVYFILFALSEMTVHNPDSGSFRTFASEAYGEGTGFVVGWVYWTGMVLAMSGEATAISILVTEWIPNISIPLLGSFIIIGVTLLNLLGASKLSNLESGLAIVKVMTILAFIVVAVLLVIGLFPGTPRVGIGELRNESLFPGGITGLAGSMLIVMFAYAGFEVIGLAASEAENPKETIPKAIKYTVAILLGFYIISVAVLLPLIPTGSINGDTSPMVAALNRWGITWAGTVINVVLITAILSTMLAGMFGLGRMMRSLADEGHAPNWLKDKSDVPYRGILFSGFGMLVGLGFGLLLPQVYLFLISAGGFALLFTYVIIMATHIRYRKKHGCPAADDKCKLGGYPYSSLFVLICLVVAIVSMPFVPGQETGLIAGIVMVAFYAVSYTILKYSRRLHENNVTNFHTRVSTEFSEELSKNKKDKKNHTQN